MIVFLWSLWCTGFSVTQWMIVFLWSLWCTGFSVIPMDDSFSVSVAISFHRFPRTWFFQVSEFWEFRSEISPIGIWTPQTMLRINGSHIIASHFSTNFFSLTASKGLVGIVSLFTGSGWGGSVVTVGLVSLLTGSGCGGSVVTVGFVAKSAQFFHYHGRQLFPGHSDLFLSTSLHSALGCPCPRTLPWDVQVFPVLHIQFQSQLFYGEGHVLWKNLLTFVCIWLGPFLMLYQSWHMQPSSHF